MRAGEASTTAQRVARHRLGFTRVVTDYGHPEADQRLQADVAAGLDGPPSRLGPYLQARTAFFDRVVVAAIEAGTSQVVAVGAGYDGRSLRYARAGVRWFELDHPSTQADKRDRLSRLGIESSGIGFAAADFAGDDVAGALGSIGHDAARPSLFTCEGVAAYLSGEVLSSLLSALASVAAPGSRLAVEIPVEPRTPAEQVRRAGLGQAVARVGEPLGSSRPRAELAPMLARAGWRVERAVDPGGVDLEVSERSTAFVLAAPGSRPA